MEKLESALEKIESAVDASAELTVSSEADVLAPPTPELEAAVATFNDRQTQLKGLALKVTVGLIDLGRELNGIKQLVGRGKWIKWFNSPENTLNCSLRTAQMYMALADYAADPEKFAAISAMDPMKAYQTAGIVKIKEVKSDAAPANSEEGTTTESTSTETALAVSETPGAMPGLSRAYAESDPGPQYGQTPDRTRANSRDRSEYDDTDDHGEPRGRGKKRGKGSGDGDAEPYDPNADSLMPPPRRQIEMAAGEPAPRHADEGVVNSYFPVIPKFQAVDYKRALKTKRKGFALVLSKQNWKRELQVLLEKDELLKKLEDGFFIQLSEQN